MPASDEPSVEDETVHTELGTVYLVGSGPGDPELLTVKAQRLLEDADIVLHDKLPGPEIIDMVPEANRQDVGKRAHGNRTPQSEINERLVALARDGQNVVRLKGGDSFVFGRGGEEAEYLAAHGIPFEVVPGITSAVAAPAVAGIPVTHRDHASSVSFVTGHEDPTKPESAVDWEALATAGGTIVVLMGVTRLPEYTAALIEGGMAPETPVALIERGTWTTQQVATGTLETIVDARDTNDISPPAVTVIGGVASTRKSVVEFLRNDYDAATEDMNHEPR
ncbi:uroporphyrinogen-III C-methyltransferase [Natronorubrum thiooxidans]|uniref:uroporphyrinogen-III C-methyltransferase n=1 Tax=Natronorubrum thiooxidans TaxID=308853 RepID=A0A1N7EW90_9EURY|nr:uroporphyrinogen-III C-methyltransferase [Natronorubrum thiooxidans]SIR92363.1 uroporphyrin-III C-methyltransferase [Natronorubrum thiooxidans]